MLRQPTTQSQRRLAALFKEFVSKNLLKHFKHSQQTLNQWNYFSSLISQQSIDYQKLQVYIEVLSTGQSHHSLSPSKNQHNLLLKTPSEEKKTNSGIFKKQQLERDNERGFDMQLNKTVGGNADRIKFTGMLQSKSNAYTLESKEKKTFMKKGSGGVAGLIESIGGLSGVMGDNHAKMESGGKGSGTGAGTGNGGVGNGGGGSFYKW